VREARIVRCMGFIVVGSLYARMLGWGPRRDAWNHVMIGKEVGLGGGDGVIEISVVQWQIERYGWVWVWDTPCRCSGIGGENVEWAGEQIGEVEV
jgi:hypothetical protein